jgi:hypothetical protein
MIIFLPAKSVQIAPNSVLLLSEPGSPTPPAVTRGEKTRWAGNREVRVWCLFSQRIENENTDTPSPSKEESGTGDGGEFY